MFSVCMIAKEKAICFFAKKKRADGNRCLRFWREGGRVEGRG